MGVQIIFKRQLIRNWLLQSHSTITLLSSRTLDLHVFEGSLVFQFDRLLLWNLKTVMWLKWLVNQINICILALMEMQDIHAGREFRIEQHTNQHRHHNHKQKHNWLLMICSSIICWRLSSIPTHNKIYKRKHTLLITQSSLLCGPRESNRSHF